MARVHLLCTASVTSQHGACARIRAEEPLLCASSLTRNRSGCQSLLLMGAALLPALLLSVSSRATMSGSMASGDVVGRYRETTEPSFAMRNLAKFHLMPLMPSDERCDLSHWYSGWAPSPLTSTLPKIGNWRPGQLLSTKPRISAIEPGSWPPNSFDGNARTSNPRGASRLRISTSSP
eukprot:Amastigsp_a2005_90.p2 type:complete len:178 gc:universal Amastigsp_a2005_90:811-278(-)